MIVLAVEVFFSYVFGLRRKGKYHEERSDYPIHYYAKDNLLPDLLFAEDVVESFVANFAEDWIHHY
jgi:dTDP-4-dehydrorhamnose reductase